MALHDKLPDYTGDLNVLARLEAKLPDHQWTINIVNRTPLASELVAAQLVVGTTCHDGLRRPS